MIHLILSNRPTLYATPELAPVANNRGDRINKRAQAILGKLTALYPGAEGLVKEQMQLISGTKPWKRKAQGMDGGGSGEESGVKAEDSGSGSGAGSAGSTVSTGKKRKGAGASKDARAKGGKSGVKVEVGLEEEDVKAEYSE